MSWRILPLLLLAACAAPATAGSHSDAPAYAQMHGVSEPEAERRMQAQAEIGAFQERVLNDPAFAGLYIEHEPEFRAVVMFTDDAAARLARYTTDPLYEARQAPVSYAALQAAQDELNAALQRERLYFLHTSLDVRANQIELAVVDDDALRAAEAAGRITLPSFVRVVEQGGIVAEAQAGGPVMHFPQARYPAGMELGALARGRLAIIDGCLRLVGPDGQGSLILWPSSALLEVEGDRVRVRDRLRGGVVSVGDLIEMGGGESPALSSEFLTAPLPEACAGPYWIAATGWRKAD